MAIAFNREAEAIYGDSPIEDHMNALRSESLSVRSFPKTFQEDNSSSIKTLRITEATSKRFGKPLCYFVSSKVKAKALTYEVM